MIAADDALLNFLKIFFCSNVHKNFEIWRINSEILKKCNKALIKMLSLKKWLSSLKFLWGERNSKMEREYFNSAASNCGVVAATNSWWIEFSKKLFFEHATSLFCHYKSFQAHFSKKYRALSIFEELLQALKSVEFSVLSRTKWPPKTLFCDDV